MAFFVLTLSLAHCVPEGRDSERSRSSINLALCLFIDPRDTSGFGKNLPIRTAPHAMSFMNIDTTLQMIKIISERSKASGHACFFSTGFLRVRGIEVSGSGAEVFHIEGDAPQTAVDCESGNWANEGRVFSHTSAAEFCCRDSTFTDITNTDRGQPLGGAIAVTGDCAKLELTRCTFTRCRNDVNEWGTIVFSRAVALVLSSNHFNGVGYIANKFTICHFQCGQNTGWFDEVTITDCHFKDMAPDLRSTKESGGSGFTVRYARSLNLVGCTFTRTVSNDMAGALLLELRNYQPGSGNRKIGLTDCVFDDIQSAKDGSCIQIVDDLASLSLTRCRFTNVRTTGTGLSGGAVNIQGSCTASILVDQCNFTECNKAIGSCLYQKPGGSVPTDIAIRDTTFDRCEAETANSGQNFIISVYGSQLIFSGNRLLEMNDGKSIVSILSVTNSVFDMSDCVYRSYKCGRVIEITRASGNSLVGTTWKIRNCVFTDCSSTSGNMFVVNRASDSAFEYFAMDNCTFNGMTGENGLFLMPVGTDASSGNVTITDSTFARCNCGEAVVRIAKGRTIFIDNCTFHSFKTPAIWISHDASSQITLNECKFSEFPISGEAVIAYTAVLIQSGTVNQIRNCHFTDCQSSVGSALSLTTTQTTGLEICDCSFTTCVQSSGTEAKGAAFLSTGGSICFIRCIFDGCKSVTGDGCAIMTTSTNERFPIENCTFKNTQDMISMFKFTYSSGSIVSPLLTDCNFISLSTKTGLTNLNNFGGAGIGLSGMASFSIERCHFDDIQNKGAKGGAIFVTFSSPGTLFSAKECRFTNIRAYSTGGCLTFNSCTEIVIAESVIDGVAVTAGPQYAGVGLAFEATFDTVNITGTTFRRCTGQKGAAMWHDNGQRALKVFQFTGCTIDQCSGDLNNDERRSVIVMKCESVIFRKNTIINMDNNFNEILIRLSDNEENIAITNCTFRNLNRRRIVWLTGTIASINISDMIIDDVRPVSGFTDGLLSAAETAPSQFISISGCVFNNVPSAALHISNPVSVFFQDCHFTSIVLTSASGPLISSGCKTTSIKSCTFSQINSGCTLSINTGTPMKTGSSALIEDCDFERCNVGAFHVIDASSIGELTIKKCDFGGNEANSGTKGSSISLGINVKSIIDGCHFSGGTSEASQVHISGDMETTFKDCCFISSLTFASAVVAHITSESDGSAAIAFEYPICFDRSQEHSVSFDGGQTPWNSLPRNVFNCIGCVAHTFEFTESGRFSASSGFSRSRMFTGTDRFTSSNPFSQSSTFTHSGVFSETAGFSSTMRFSQSSAFAMTGRFTSSNPFSQSSTFTHSGVFSATAAFSSTVCFFQSSVFAMTEGFTGTRGFTHSSHFLPSQGFSDSVHFTGSQLFQASGAFSSSADFSCSDSLWPRSSSILSSAVSSLIQVTSIELPASSVQSSESLSQSIVKTAIPSSPLTEELSFTQSIASSIDYPTSPSESSSQSIEPTMVPVLSPSLSLASSIDHMASSSESSSQSMRDITDSGVESPSITPDVSSYLSSSDYQTVTVAVTGKSSQFDRHESSTVFTIPMDSSIDRSVGVSLAVSLTMPTSLIVASESDSDQLSRSQSETHTDIDTQSLSLSQSQSLSQSLSQRQSLSVVTHMSASSKYKPEEGGDTESHAVQMSRSTVTVTSTSQAGTEKGGLGTGAIVGIVVGILALIAIIIVVVILVTRKRKGSAGESSQQDGTELVEETTFNTGIETEQTSALWETTSQPISENGPSIDDEFSSQFEEEADMDLFEG